MATVYLGLGSNLGDRIENLRRAIEALEKSVVLKNKSSVYETLPHGVGEQPLYLNMVVLGETDSPPHELLALVKSIETELGREANTHNQPRPMDIDILFHGDSVINTSELVIPHPELQNRAFVLVPLEEIAPAHVHPTLRRPVIDLLDELGGDVESVWLSKEQL